MNFDTNFGVVEPKTKSTMVLSYPEDVEVENMLVATALYEKRKVGVFRADYHFFPGSLSADKKNKLENELTNVLIKKYTSTQFAGSIKKAIDGFFTEPKFAEKHHHISLRYLTKNFNGLTPTCGLVVGHKLADLHTLQPKDAKLVATCNPDFKTFLAESILDKPDEIYGEILSAFTGTMREVLDLWDK